MAPGGRQSVLRIAVCSQSRYFWNFWPFRRASLPIIDLESVPRQLFVLEVYALVEEHPRWTAALSSGTCIRRLYKNQFATCYLSAGRGSSGTTISPKNPLLFSVQVSLDFVAIPWRSRTVSDAAQRSEGKYAAQLVVRHVRKKQTTMLRQTRTPHTLVSNTASFYIHAHHDNLENNSSPTFSPRKSEYTFLKQINKEKESGAEKLTSRAEQSLQRRFQRKVLYSQICFFLSIQRD